ncbi:uncharacterized protein F4807DRAFT_17241 [Annulohypoxylon truncatum]|uniref:uncharacterized protein n=1 Tax=Annulohypoxylon truncatum TaxID=327061 RepID=UPI0020077B3B|nr:uncharacterized protein F4807DRAFT_17241 [Annulohypoxylon truncatum]KAI1215012.1 hypothetical protein F4807DRAFT_17241 [Annulohypoxylon truncatum]
MKLEELPRYLHFGSFLTTLLLHPTISWRSICTYPGIEVRSDWMCHYISHCLMPAYLVVPSRTPHVCVARVTGALRHGLVAKCGLEAVTTPDRYSNISPLYRY